MEGGGNLSYHPFPRKPEREGESPGDRGRLPSLFQRNPRRGRVVKRLGLLWIGLALASSLGPARISGQEMAVDFSRKKGVLRALHGVNAGPLSYRGVVDLSRYHRQLRIPLTRLHDVPWGNYCAVDISIVFPDFRDDPGKAENYDFASTDDYIAAIVKLGIPILYRLGESIEHTPRKYRVHPPKDFKKWAEICCGIIRHYNEGWAGGFHYGIRYWEIWNEPDNKPAMWTGTDEQFLKLFEVTAKKIKKRWPGLQVGGPALANAGRLRGGKFTPSRYARLFLAYCRDRGVPLDFFSWHRYTKNPAEYAPLVRGVRKMLDQYGFQGTESHMNEWNFLPWGSWKGLTKGGQGLLRERWLAEMSGPRGAAFDAWVLMSLQGAPVDMADFFTADTQMLGMFTDCGVPKKNFYAFKAFRMLLDTPLRVETPGPEEGKIAWSAGLGRDGKEASVLLSCFFAPPERPALVIRNLPWKAPARFEVFLVDGSHDLALTRSGVLGAGGRLALPELKDPSVVLVKLRPEM